MEREARTIGRFGFVTSTGTRSCWRVQTARQMEIGDPSPPKRMSDTFTPGPARLMPAELPGMKIADLSVHHVERFILEEGHTAQRLTSDYSYDVLTCTFDEQG